MYVHTHTHTRTHARTHTLTHSHRHIHTYIHTYLQQPTEGAHHAAPMHKELAHSSGPLKGARLSRDPEYMQGTRAPQEPFQPGFALFASSWVVHGHTYMG